MISKILCWLFGCKVKAKAVTRVLDKTEANPLTGAEDHIKMYRWEQLSHCLRCNKPNPEYRERS